MIIKCEKCNTYNTIDDNYLDGKDSIVITCEKCGQNNLVAIVQSHYAKHVRDVDEKYCPKCGAIIKKIEETCPKCKSIQPLAKDKSTAIMLNMLFSSFGWLLYTHHKDMAKFGISMIIQVVSIVLSIIYLAWYFFILVSVCLWVWAVVDAIKKPKKWYEDYIK